MVMFMHETAAAPRPHSNSPSSTIEAVFEVIIGDIIRGVYAPGARLPAERELARALAASRPTLREALRRLTEWRLVEPRRGSGIVVRSPSEWSIEVLPAFLRHARSGPGEPTITAPADYLPADYLDVNEQVLDALERGEGAAAVATLDGYLARHDRRFMTSLGTHL
jgi:DNA-binding transcriptional regulator YhcF (GntR family)